MNQIKKFLISIILIITVLWIMPSQNSYALEDWEQEILDEYNLALKPIISEKGVMGSVYLCDTYDVKSAPSEDAGKVITVYSGHLVFLKECAMDDEQSIWYKVSLAYGSKEYEGFVLRKNIAISDERFLDCEEEYYMNPSYWDMSMMVMSLGLDDEDDGTPLLEPEPAPYSEDIMQFPESYRERLNELKKLHPSWTFVKMYTGIDFNTAIDNEMLDTRSLVEKSFAACCKEKLQSTNWYYPSREILEYYMDPRNGISLANIFQFEQLTYNATYHTQDSLDAYLNTTFMNNSQKAPMQDITYSDIIWNISRVKGVSPFMAAARIVQEQGDGSSPLISGTVPGYEGYYNYFNIGAKTGTPEETIRSGLEYAKTHYATGSYAAIEAGIELLVKGYISTGQDTLYLQKYNVVPGSPYLYNNQYMQNISAGFSEGYKIYLMYKSASALDNAFVFKIPVYENMPDEPIAKQTSTTNLIVDIPATAFENGITGPPIVWIDGVPQTSITRNGYLVIDTKVNTGKTAIIYKYNSSGACTGMYTWVLEYTSGAYTAKYESELEDLLSYHGFSVRINNGSGIRYKSGIVKTVKDKLINSGIDGYKLKEYGTLAMKDVNRATYPFILNGEKVAKGVAYGTDPKGVFHNDIFETVDGRERFTSVLVDLDVKNYKADYAFRSYIILNNGSRDICLYGYPMARSIYYLSDKLINMNYYEVGSDADVFLKEILKEADDYEKQNP